MQSISLHFFCGLLILAQAIAQLNYPPVVSTSNGQIQGSTCPGESRARRFLSIPYAQPPVRFSAPQPYNASFGSPLFAVHSAPSCPQFGASWIESGAQSEDCLFLDIWTPAKVTNSSKLPVKVWLYGGADNAGGITNATYNGCNIATDAVIVSINYRVGPLGWLALPGAGIEGNFGLLDQLLALQWIQDNIQSFGGNKDQVLLFGQSAGAVNAYALSTLPQAPSLINAVILESGGGRTYKTAQAVQSTMAKIVESLGCKATDVSCIRGAPLAKWNASLPKVIVPPAGTLTLTVSLLFGPVVDCNVLPAQPADVGTRVPAIFGSNSNEGTIFAYPYFPSRDISSSNYDQFLDNNFLSAAPLVKARYPWPGESKAFETMSSIIRDAGFQCPAARGARLASSKGLPVWTYSFNHTPSCSWFPGIKDNQIDILRATHTAEIPFVFGVTDNLPPPDGKCSFNAGEKKLSSHMSAIWTSMAANRNPGHASNWPGFNGNQSLGVNIQNEIVPGYVDYAACGFWDDINEKLYEDLLGNATAICQGGAGLPVPNHAGIAATRNGWLICLTVAYVIYAFASL